MSNNNIIQVTPVLEKYEIEIEDVFLLNNVHF